MDGRDRLAAPLFLRLLHGFAGANQTRAVEDDEQGADAVEEGGANRRDVAQGREIDAHHDEAQADGEVLVHQDAGLARQPNQEGDAAQVVVHQRDGGALDRDVAAEGSHGDAHVAGRRRVVDAVADHRHKQALLLQLVDVGLLLFGQASGLDLGDADLGGNRLGHPLVVTCDHAE